MGAYRKAAVEADAHFEPLLERDDDVAESSAKRLEKPKFWRMVRLFRRLAAPYWRRNYTARRDIAVVLAFCLLQSAIAVIWSYISRDFWTALNHKDYNAFVRQCWMFLVALCVFSPINVYYGFFRDRCAIRWRAWTTRFVLHQYVANRNYYALQQEGTVDNPDQRIAQDLASFTNESLGLILTVIVTTIDIISFSVVLFSIYPPLFLVIIVYASFGTGFISYIGRKLISLIYAQIVNEADFRYSLIRIRDNAESVAFFGGERTEQAEIERRFADVFSSAMRVIFMRRKLAFLQTAYNYAVTLLPAVFVCPLYFQGKIELGTVSQSFSAFNHILGDFSLVINRFDQLSGFGAGLERLYEFVNVLEKNLDESDRAFGTTYDEDDVVLLLRDKDADGDDTAIDEESSPSRGSASSSGAPFQSDVELGTDNSSTEIELVETDANALVVQELSLFTPRSAIPRKLFSKLSLKLSPGERLLIAGPSGVGKSSLLRAIAGLWKNGSSGRIERPVTSNVFFLPQRPYCTLGTLRANLLYPSVDDGVERSDAELLEVLEKVDLQELPEHMGGLDAVRDWADTLSLGEQQRLQLARLLLAKPRMALIDEGSAALSVDAECRMYRLLEEMGITVVSVGHRPSLLKYHNVLLRLGVEGTGWKVEGIQQDQRDRVVTQNI